MSDIRIAIMFLAGVVLIAGVVAICYKWFIDDQYK